MKIVGLTGGIGSGKTTVAAMFADLGVPVYIADEQAKRLTNTSKVIRRKLIALMGENTYTDEGINRQYVADKIFNNKDLLEKVNGIIHPKVGQHFKRWIKKQTASYCIKEAAILFESGSYKDCDHVILVTAPKEIRVARIMKRDNTSLGAIEERMANQWPDKEKRAMSDFEIENIDMVGTRKKVAQIHAKLR